MKLWILVTSFSLAWAGWSLAQHKSEELLATPSEEYFYYLPRLSQEEIQQCLQNPFSSILVCPEGTLVSLDFFLKGDLVELESSADTRPLLKIKRTFYLRCYPDDQIMISLDGSNWKTWQEMLTGITSLSIEIDESGSGLKLGTEAYLRSRQEGN